LSYLLVLSTASSRKEALKLADLILSKRLAACVNISGSIESHYWWKGKKAKGREVQIWIKTRTALYKKLERTLKNHHSYSVPEILAFPIRQGSRDYLSWLGRETRG
jgi:periplasmic divalent cation tolerance protein